MSRLPSPGDRLGGYRIEGLLGRGGMGGVYRAVELATGREVAVKVMLPGPANARRIERFEREGAVLARLGGTARVVGVHASGEAEGYPSIAVEASRVSEARGRLDEAKERVRGGLARQPDAPGLRARADELGLGR